MSVSIVVPCYRSAETLPTLVARLNTVMSGLTIRYEVILVVDGSPDGTWTAARRLAADHPATVRALHLARNYGQHNAIIAGVRAARHDVIVTMDDDLQHPPEEVPKLLAALTDDLDVVYGVAEVEEHGWLRSLASRMVKTGMAGPIGVKNARMLSAFRAFRAFVQAGFDQVHGPHASVDVALSWTTTRVGAVTVRMSKREIGKSGYTFRRLLRHSVNMLLGYSTAPLRVVTYLGLMVGLGGLVMLGRVLWLYFTDQIAVAGFTTIASLVALFSSAQMISIGVVGEYIGRIHASGMGRPTYVIRERLDAQSGDDLVNGAVSKSGSEQRKFPQMR